MKTQENSKLKLLVLLSSFAILSTGCSDDGDDADNNLEDLQANTWQVSTGADELIEFSITEIAQFDREIDESCFTRSIEELESFGDNNYALENPDEPISVANGTSLTAINLALSEEITVDEADFPITLRSWVTFDVSADTLTRRQRGYYFDGTSYAFSDSSTGTITNYTVAPIAAVDLDVCTN
ncbi:MAG: hypothetical protein AAGB12_14635 [Pseudomonadota bacterium]